jgi:hypothetical protein
VVLVGNRRMLVARELEIEPVTETWPVGQGEAADALRFRLAIASNIGAKPMNAEERGRIAQYLYGEREWSQAKIAQALMVSQKTISNDLSGISNVTNSGQTERRGRPRGRPRKNGESTPAQQDKDEQVLQLYEGGMTQKDAARAVGYDPKSANYVVRRARWRRNGGTPAFDTVAGGANGPAVAVDPQPVADQPPTSVAMRVHQPLVLQRPLDPATARQMLAECDFDEVVGFVGALIHAVLPAQRTHIRQAVCGVNGEP